MPRPDWHEELNALKPEGFNMFNWAMIARLRHFLSPSKFPKSSISLAINADHMLRTDRSSWSGPLALARYFDAIKSHSNAAFCYSLAASLRTTSPTIPKERHTTHKPSYPNEPSVPRSIIIEQLEAEALRAFDPETFFLTPTNRS